MNCMVSGLLRGASDVFPLMGYDAALMCIQLLTFRSRQQVPSSVKKQSNENYFWITLTLEYGTDRLSRNVGNCIEINGA